MCSPSPTTPWQAHFLEYKSGACRISLFGSSWHKQCALFLHYPLPYFSSLRIAPRRSTNTCIFCWWVQVCYGYGLWQSVCLWYPKHSSFKDIYGSRLQTVCTLSSIQQWNIRKRSSGLCRRTSDVRILISLCLKYVVWILSTISLTSPVLQSFM